MNRMEFERLAQRVMDRSCTAEEFGRVEAALRESAEMRRIFREGYLLDGMLEAEHEASAGPARKVVPMSAVLRMQRKQAVRTALAAAAALVAVAAVALHFVLLKPTPMLAVDAAPNTVWQVSRSDGSAADAGDLEVGDTIQVSGGTVRLDFGDGVSGIVQGPARMVFERQGRLRMAYGIGRFEVPAEAAGFEVKSRRLDVTDLGTSFGVILPQDGVVAPEVHVFEGRVQAAARDGKRERLELAAGEAARLSVVGGLEPVPADPSRFFTELPDDLPHLRFTFEPGSDGGLEVLGTHAAVSRVRAAVEGGHEWVEGVRGRAVRFTDDDGRVRTDWEGTLGSRPRTITAWVRHPKAEPAHRFQSIAGWGDPTLGRAGKFELLLFAPPESGEVLPRLSFDRFLFTGTTGLADGRWHHLAAVYEGPEVRGREMVRLYVDGVREPLHPQHTALSDLPREPHTLDGGSPLMIGHVPQRGDRRTFKGAVDEVIVFEAALPEARVRELAEERK